MKVDFREVSHLPKFTMMQRWTQHPRELSFRVSASFCHVAFHYAALETESTSGGRERRASGAFVPLCASPCERKVCTDETTMHLCFAASRLQKSSQFIFLLLLLLLSRRSVGFLLLSLSLSSPTSCKSRTC